MTARPIVLGAGKISYTRRRWHRQIGSDYLLRSNNTTKASFIRVLRLPSVSPNKAASHSDAMFALRALRGEAGELHHSGHGRPLNSVMATRK